MYLYYNGTSYSQTDRIWVCRMVMRVRMKRIGYGLADQKTERSFWRDIQLTRRAEECVDDSRYGSRKLGSEETVEFLDEGMCNAEARVANNAKR